MKKNKINYLYRLIFKPKISIIIPIIFALLLLYSSIVPVIDTGIVDVSINSGKIMHLLSYGILAALLFCYFDNHKFSNSILNSILIAGCIGIFIEIIQFFIPYRYFDFLDIIVNFAGASLVYPAVLIARDKFKWI
jgi:VanZ family protein